jgi:glycosyltransferase involved in cell wall biosynthesis
MSAHTVPHLSTGAKNRWRNCSDCSRLSADILHITGDIHYVAPFLKGKARILTIHDCHILHQLPWYKRAVVKLMWFTIPARFLDHITVNSNTTKKQVLETIRYPADKITVIPVSVSSTIATSNKQFAAGKPTILHIGTKANKNLPRLAEALSGIPCNLDIVGKLTPELTTVLKLHNIDYQNYVNLTESELAKRYSNCDIVAFVSTHEGFGMPIIEAQLAQKPCLTSDISSMPETAGAGALLVDPYDVTAIRQGIDRLIADAGLRQKLIEEGNSNCKRFSPDEISRKFTELYLNLAQKY